VHPELIRLGPLAIHWYGVMLALAFLLGIWTASRRAPLTGIAGENMADAGLWLILGAIAGARTFYVISYWDTVMANPLFPRARWTEVFMVQRGGLVYYGGLIGASLACIAFARRRKLPLWKLADIFAPSIALGYVFGRIGCLMNGCCYGRACSLPWAIRFPEGNPLDPPTFPVHPAQVYDSLLNLGFYFGLAWLYRRKRFDGQIFATYLMGYALLRSFVETFRGDYSAEHLHRGLTPAHLLSIGIFAAGAVLFWMRRPRPETRG
jgi:phosphatidylglycerol---prolipoprotein diacylglyceryl transferase